MMALVYGGSGSGKSEFAETLLASFSRSASALVYVATMYPTDDEARRRIERHQANRAHKGFVTREVFTGLDAADIPDGAAVLLECLGNLVANEMFSPPGAGADTAARVMRGVEAVAARADRLVVVSNDVFSDGLRHAPETHEYQRVLAELNRRVAERSGAVVETVCGIPLWRKRNGAWDA